MRSFCFLTCFWIFCTLRTNWRIFLVSGSTKIPEVHRFHLAGSGCQDQRGRRGKISVLIQRKHTHTHTHTHKRQRLGCILKTVRLFASLCCVGAGHRFCQRPGAAERMQLFNSGDSSHGEDHSGQAALGLVHRNTSRLHSHSKSEFSRKTQTKHFVFLFFFDGTWAGCTSGCSSARVLVSPF